MRIKALTLIMFIAFGVLGCGTTTKYHWGHYEDSLYRYYKNPAEVEELAEALAEIIEKGERDGRVPPGIYADYGYLFLLTGNTGEAIIYFEKEKNTWPECSMLMDKMIATTKTTAEEKPTQNAVQTSSGGADQ